MPSDQRAMKEVLEPYLGNTTHRQAVSTESPISLRSICIYASCILAAIGPIYWLPGVDPTFLRYVKSGLLSLFIGLALLLLASATRSGKAHIQIASKYGVFVGASVVLLGAISTLAILYNDDLRPTLARALSYVITAGYIFSLACCISVNGIKQLRNFLTLVLSIFPIISLLVVLANHELIVDFQVPTSLLIGQNENALGLVDYGLSGNGFGGSRTGWGAATAVATTALIALVAGNERLPKAYIVAVFVLTVFALYEIGSRGAFVAFIIGVAYDVSLRRPGFGKYVVLIVGLVIAWTVYGLLPHDSRFYFNLEGLDREAMLARLTSDRYATWVFGIEAFTQSPIVGVGVPQSHLFGRLAVHNTWIGIAASSGILGLLASMVVLFLLIVLAIGPRARGFRSNGMGGTILCGLVISLLEPGFPFESFFNTTGFWAVVMLQAAAVSIRGFGRTPRDISVVAGSHA